MLLTPFAPIGAGMVGSGFGSLAGGEISEKLGGSYELGAAIGGVVGGVAVGFAYSKISASKMPNKTCNPKCFIAGTLIAVEDGYVSIENIEAGDFVYAEKPETGEIALKRVVQTFENETNELVHVYVNGEEIITTPSHPFYVPKYGWTSAIKLRAGDVLVLLNGEYVVIEAVQHEILEEPVKVYNFEVEDFHTYFVGDNSVLVHNTCTKKKSSNPYGRKGGKAHQQKVQEIKDMIGQRSKEYPHKNINIKEEDMFIIDSKGYTPYKNRRFADVVEYQNGKISSIYQVGKVNKNGLPVYRESKAIEDIMHSSLYNGEPIYFVPYNSDIGSIIYLP